MIINQLSCVVGIVVAYILSYNKMNRMRIIILFGVALANMIVSAIYYKELTWNDGIIINWTSIIYSVIITAIAFGVVCALNIILAKPFGRGKLNDKIVKFTERANPNLDLNIMAGDLTFFGNINDMESNPQVRQLIDKRFKRVNIILKPPANNEEKIRIGKLIHLLNESSILMKFYDGNNFCDLRLRFRCISFGDGTTATINIYKFVAEKEYLTEELSSLSSNQEQRKRHQTFMNLWNIYWNALKTNQDMIQECVDAYEYLHN